MFDRRDGTPLVISDDREAALGSAYRKEMDQLANGTPEHDEARRRYVEALRSHRNRPEGFWVAAATPDAAYESLAGTIPRSEVSAVALLSDGASRLVDRFKLATWGELLRDLADNGPQGLLRRVRAAEQSDAEGKRWPRGKTYDDATVVYLNLS